MPIINAKVLQKDNPKDYLLLDRDTLRRVFFFINKSKKLNFKNEK